jgi:HEAT repeat protein
MMDTTIEGLIADCRSDDVDRQIEALIALRERDVDAALPAILPLVDSPDSTVRERAADALGQLGRQDPDVAGQALMHLLEDAEMMVRNEAAEALGVLAYRPALDRLAQALIQDEDWVVRCSCAESLGYLDDPRAADLLLPALQDEHYPVRRYAACSLGLVGRPGILPQLTRAATTEEDYRVRAELNQARYRFGDASALPPLLALATDETFDGADLSLWYELVEARDMLAHIIRNWLSEGPLPPTLSDDLLAIRSALHAVAGRWPDAQETVDQTLARLAEKFPGK